MGCNKDIYLGQQVTQFSLFFRLGGALPVSAITFWNCISHEFFHQDVPPIMCVHVYTYESEDLRAFSCRKQNTVGRKCTQHKPFILLNEPLMLAILLQFSERFPVRSRSGSRLFRGCLWLYLFLQDILGYYFKTRPQQLLFTFIIHKNHICYSTLCHQFCSTSFVKWTRIKLIFLISIGLVSIYYVA